MVSTANLHPYMTPIEKKPKSSGAALGDDAVVLRPGAAEYAAAAAEDLSLPPLERMDGVDLSGWVNPGMEVRNLRAAPGALGEDGGTS